MKKIILIIAAVLVTSCGAVSGTIDVSPVYQNPPCINGVYKYGFYGWGFYDCYGFYIGRGQYQIGPRIVWRPNIKKNNKPKKTKVVKSPTYRGPRGGGKNAQ